MESVILIPLLPNHHDFNLNDSHGSSSGSIIHTETTAPKSNWTGVASDSTGKLLAAVGLNICIYTSIDSGNNWEPSISDALQWVAVASNSKGTYYAAVARNSYIYTSADSGFYWTRCSKACFPSGINGGGVMDWTDISSSSTGQYLAATVNNGQVFLSEDFGVEFFVSQQSAITTWVAIELNGDGDFIFAASKDLLYIATGFTARVWSTIVATMIITDQYTGVAVSDDGHVLAACTQQGVVMISVNRGIHWSSKTAATASHSAISYQGVSIDKSGDRVVVIGSYGCVDISSDSGKSWTRHAVVDKPQWSSIAPSKFGEGKFLFASEGQYGYIYVSDDYGSSWSRSSYGIILRNSTKDRQGGSNTTTVTIVTPIVGVVFLIFTLAFIYYVYYKYGCPCCEGEDDDDDDDDDEEVMMVGGFSQYNRYSQHHSQHSDFSQHSDSFYPQHDYNFLGENGSIHAAAIVEAFYCENPLLREFDVVEPDYIEGDGDHDHDVYRDDDGGYKGGDDFIDGTGGNQLIEMARTEESHTDQHHLLDKDNNNDDVEKRGYELMMRAEDSTTKGWDKYLGTIISTFSMLPSSKHPLKDLRSDDESAIKDVDDDDDGSSMSSQLSRAVGTMMYQGSSMKARPHADRAKLKSLVPLRDLRSDDESAMKNHYGLYQYPSRHSVDHISDALESSPLADELTIQRTDILVSSYVGMQQDVHDGGETAVDDDLHGRKSASNIS